jgi:hypothetical protein
VRRASLVVSIAFIVAAAAAGADEGTAPAAPASSSAPASAAPPSAAPAPASASAAPAAAAAPATADAAALAARVNELGRALAALQSRVDTQAAELGELRARPVAAAPLFRVGRLAVSLFGFVQADAVAYSQASTDEVNPATGAPLNETRFLIRRARLRTDVDYGPVAGTLELDGNTTNGPVVRLIDADVSGCWPRCAMDPPIVMGTLGLMRIPFGFEVQQKDYVRLFLERANVMRALFPGEFDLGARLQGGWRWLRWQLAAMNGHPSGDKQFALVSPTQSKDLLGRVGADTSAHPRLRLSGGISALWGTGFHTGTPDTKDHIVWRDTNGDGQVDASTELIGVSGQPAQPSQTFRRYALGGDVRVLVDVPRLGELTLYAELVWATNLDRALVVADPVAVGRDLRELGWYVAATQQLGRWAAVGVRYDRYDPDADAREQSGAAVVPRDRSFATLALVAAFEWRPLMRFSVEYDRNWNALGRSASGAPTTLGAHVVTFRGQVTF